MDVFAPLQTLSDVFTYNILNLIRDSYFANAVNFFIYDSLKIGILLVLINYLMAAVRYYFPTERARDILTSRKWYGIDYLLAALLGVITPFCSCSSIPLFIGFLSAGIPLGVTFAFLISSPLVNESSLYLFPAMFGIKITVWYNLTGIAVAVIGGIVIQKLNVEKFVKGDFLKSRPKKFVETENLSGSLPLKKLIIYFWQEGFEITKKIYPYALLGIGIGALIHGFVPASLIEQYLNGKNWWDVPLSVVFGVPLYANSVSVIPVAQALIEKGVATGTVLAFMTSIVTLSIPEAMILKRVMKWQLLSIFFVITIMGIILLGYLFNLLF